MTQASNLAKGGSNFNAPGQLSLTTGVTGTLPIANGGTGETTRQAAIDALAGAVTSGQYLRGNGTDVVMSAIQAADVPTLNQNTTGTAAGLSTTLAVGSGGTGATTLTANNVLLGNGTSALQVVAPGTNGNVLTSNGTTWTSAAISAGGNYIMRVYTSDTTWSKPAGIKAIKVTCVGGGGGGGGSANARGAGAGAGGGTAILYLTAASISASYSLTIGGGGSATSGGGATGGTGGTSSFGGACSATGGGGGTGNNNDANNSPAGGSGGVGSGGTINLAGDGGDNGSGQSNYSGASGGGSSLGGGSGTQGYNTTGRNGREYGGGGSGANSSGSSGAGYQGVIIVEEFY